MNSKRKRAIPNKRALVITIEEAADKSFPYLRNQVRTSASRTYLIQADEQSITGWKQVKVSAQSKAQPDCIYVDMLVNTKGIKFVTLFVMDGDGLETHPIEDSSDFMGWRRVISDAIIEIFYEAASVS